MVKRIAVFGGSFDPIHLGHLKIIRAVHEQVQPDEFLLVPCGKPPHREPLIADPEQRLKMLDLAINELRESGINIVVDRREIDREGPSYSYLTLEELQHENPNALLMLAMGWDSLVSFSSWRSWPRILKVSCLLVVKRGGDKREIPPENGIELKQWQSFEPAAGKVYQLQFDEISLSSTEVRSLLKDLDSGRAMPKDFPLSAGVYEFINKQKIYSG